MSALLALVALLLSILTGHGGASVQSAPVPQQHVVTHALPDDAAHASERAHQVPRRPVTHAGSMAPTTAPADGATVPPPAAPTVAAPAPVPVECPPDGTARMSDDPALSSCP